MEYPAMGEGTQMTGRTHDLAAFSALSVIAVIEPLHSMSLATTIAAISANFIGALAPDIDEPSADFWERFRGGEFWGKVLAPLMGGHRFISHSIVGLVLAGFLLGKLLDLASSVILVDMYIVWWSFMIGYASHLVMDSFTREGVPWFWPLPWKIGFPPLKSLRMKSGGLFEKAVVFPGLLIATGYLYYAYYDKFLEFIRQYIK